MLTGSGNTIRNARKLRKTMSLPEVLLWQQLRTRPDGIKFRRQHPAGPFILDFYCNDAMLAIEIDGGAHDGRTEADARRDAWLIAQGVRTLRIPAQAVLTDLDAVLRHIIRHARRPLHHPADGPPPRTGED